MDIEKALKITRIIIQKSNQKSLNDTQTNIFQELWKETSTNYVKIADKLNLSEEGISSAARSMYKILQQAIPMEGKLERRNFKSLLIPALEGYIRKTNQYNHPIEPIQENHNSLVQVKLEPTTNNLNLNNNRARIKLESADRPVPIPSKFYIVRKDEALAYQAIEDPGAVIRIIGKRKSGATSLVSRIVNHAELLGNRFVLINFQGVEKDALTSMKSFAKWFCLEVSDQLEIIDYLDEYWRESRPNASAQKYFEKYLLKNLSVSIVIIFERIDIIFDNKRASREIQETARIFFGLIRSWIDRQSSIDLWRKIKYIIVQGTQDIDMGNETSPFNVGLEVRLFNFSKSEIINLAKKYQLNWSEKELQQLTNIFGENIGNPHLIRSLLNFTIEKNYTFEQLVELKFDTIQPFKQYLGSDKVVFS